MTVALARSSLSVRAARSFAASVISAAAPMTSAVRLHVLKNSGMSVITALPDCAVAATFSKATAAAARSQSPLLRQYGQNLSDSMRPSAAVSG